MAFVKLDAAILTSSLWVERGQRDLFITALLMALPFETPEPMPSYRIRSVDPDGFVVPPGSYGFVRAAGVGIIRMALMDEQEGFASLEALAAPDPQSRSTAYEGRRMVRVDGGFIVLNFMKYRDRDQTAAERMRKYRERRSVTRNGYGEHSHVTQAEAEAEAEDRRKKKRKGETKTGTRFALSTLPEDWRVACKVINPDLDPEAVFAKFADYWRGVPGVKGEKADWLATWRNWCRKEVQYRAARQPRSEPPTSHPWDGAR